MAAAMSAAGMPAFTGCSGVPVTETNPASHCTSMSYARLSRVGPDAPYPRCPRRSAGVRGAQGGRVQAEAGGGALGEVLHEHVGAGDEPPYDARAARILQVQGDGLLAPVAPDEVRGEPVGGGVVARARSRRRRLARP